MQNIRRKSQVSEKGGQRAKRGISQANRAHITQRYMRKGPAEVGGNDMVCAEEADADNLRSGGVLRSSRRIRNA